MRFAEVRARLGDAGRLTDPWMGRQLYDAVRSGDARDVLELGTGHGASTAYLAAAVAANGGGQVVSVDAARHVFADPAPAETLARCGLDEVVSLVRVPHSSYTWWLRGLLRASDAPRFDLCFLDGAHDWHVDGLAAVLVERLLRPGGWLVLDDLDWSYATGTGPRPPHLSDEEVRACGVREVFDVVIAGHPGFDELRVVDGSVGWARKGTGARRLTLETTTARSDILVRRVRMAVRRLGASRRSGRRTRRGPGA